MNLVLDPEDGGSLLWESAHQMDAGSNFTHLQVYQIHLISPLKVHAFNSGASGAEQF